MSQQGTVLVVDDEPSVLAAFRRALRSDPTLEILTAADPVEGLRVVAQQRPDVVVTDLAMPGMDGLALLRRVKELDPTVEVIVITAHGSVETAVTALRSGAFDFVTKPFDSIDRMIARVRSAAARRRLQVRLGELQSDRGDEFGRGGIVGRSAAIQEVIRTVRDISGACINVLIRGESGTGKELAARAVHQSSPRRHKPLVAVNCSALVENLLESELFGHAKGSFTGATANKRGLFEEAHEGTIFLDEIGELSPQMQAKLLRVLQSGEVKRIGENQNRIVDVRVIAATNRDLEVGLRTGGFREDLYYRLNVIALHLPALRERRDDIPVIVEHFLGRFAKRLNKSFEGFAPAFVEALMAYDWPGNVRELENVIERAVVLERGTVLSLASLPPHVRVGADRRAFVPTSVPSTEAGGSGPALPSPSAAPPPPPWVCALPERYQEARDTALAAFHRTYFEGLLLRTGGNISEAARVSGVERSNLKRMLKRAGVAATGFRDEGAPDPDPHAWQ